MRFFFQLIVILGVSYFIFQKYISPPIPNKSQESEISVQKSLSTQSSHKQSATDKEIIWNDEDLAIKNNLSQKYHIPANAIRLSDVQLVKDFPKFDFIKNSLYSVVLEKKSMPFKNAFRTLNQFAQHFFEFYRPIIGTKKKTPMEVVFFDTEKAFNAYKKKWGIPGWVAGFYSFDHRRLFVFNAVDIEKTQSSLDYAKVPMKYKEILVPTMAGQMDSVLSIIRHEGAHQLLTQYKVLHPKTNSWIHEGLATYSEKPQIGMAHRQYQTLLGIITPLNIKDLIKIRQFGSLNSMQAMQAYTTSWALIYFLMQPSRRSDFYQYLKQLRKTAFKADQYVGGNIEQLAQFMHMSVSELEKNFSQFIELTARK